MFTIEGMAKQKKADQHKPSFMVRLPSAFAEPLDDLVEQHQSDRTEEVKIAVREYLERHNRWPRKGQKE